MANKRTVFVPHYNPTFNYTSAEDYGGLSIMNHDDFDTINGSANNKMIMCDITNSIIDKFVPELDYILISGSPAVCAFAIGTAMAHYDRVRVLRYDKQTASYAIITMEGYLNDY